MTAIKERAAFTLSEAVKAELERAVPKSKRSKFVEQAIADALLAKARRKAIEMIKTAPRFSAGGQDSVAVLRRIREERSAALPERHRPSRP